jgi:cytochrome c oxidase assembly protein subunit 15
MGALFLLQAVMGWVMVSSGLVERPSVSHFLLAAHLFLALSLIGLSAWTALGHYYGFPRDGGRTHWSRSSIAALVGLAFLLAQMAYGAFTAGLKAGLVSNTWPLMLGRLVPGAMLDQVQPPIANLVEAPLTVAFIHRWFAFAVLLAASLAAANILKGRVGLDVHRTVRLILLLGLLQIGLGVAVVVSGVSIALASLHQFNALALFLLGVFLLYHLRQQDRLGSTTAST